MYGFIGQGPDFGSPHYEISSSFPNLATHYGLLSGAGFSVTYCIATIFWGIASEKLNRKRMVAVSCIAFSVASIVTGSTNSLLMVAVMRASLGAFQGAFEPAAFSIISD
jgi:MFS family permease